MCRQGNMLVWDAHEIQSNHLGPGRDNHGKAPLSHSLRIKKKHWINL